MPRQHFRHAIICIDDYSEFRERLQRPDVEVVAIRKKSGKDLRVYSRLFKHFRRLKPAIVHTRNLAGLDGLLPAKLAGITCRIHGEHGRDIDDLGGTNKKLKLLRQLHRPLVKHYTTVSKDLEQYLQGFVGVPEDKISQIYNGVDTDRFCPDPESGTRLHELRQVFGERAVIVGTVGRCQNVKGQIGLVEAYIELLHRSPGLRRHLRLAIVGDGPQRQRLVSRLRENELLETAWIPGERKDIPDILRALDVFILPSLDEGISNTILEAMASALPVVATRVGGNPELVDDGVTGKLIEVGDRSALARAIEDYANDAELRNEHGLRARRRAEASFSIDAMVQSYLQTYAMVMRKYGFSRQLPNYAG
jgi:sugar transferase (PEP-CTERM/EpsH1 system associated)